MSGRGKCAPVRRAAAYWAEGLEGRVLLSTAIAAFGAQQTFATGLIPNWVVGSDVNGDGKADLVLTNFWSNTVGVLLGNGNGVFQTQLTFATGNLPYAVAVSDLNHDGRADLAVSNRSSDNVSVLLGNGNGTFQAQQTLGAGAAPDPIAVGDVNRDGNVDLLVANTISDSVGVFLGNGNGSFRPQLTFATGSVPHSVAAVDVNADGTPDLVVANYTSHTVSILLGNGNGTFQDQQTVTVGTQAFAGTVADLNGDGRPDVVVTSKDGASVGLLLGNGDGTFKAVRTFGTGARPEYVTASDVNGDGRLDLAVANSMDGTVGILLGNGNGTFKPQQTFACGLAPGSVCVTDMNGDGRADLAVTNGDQPGTVSVLLGDVPPVVVSIDRTAPPGPNTSEGGVKYTVTFNESVTGVDASDFTLSLAGVTATTPVVVSGSGATYVVTINGISGVGTLGLNLVDNGSIRDASGNPLQPGGRAAFGAGVTTAVLSNATSVAVGDVNGDGRQDVVVAPAATSLPIQAMLGNGNGTFGPGVTSAGMTVFSTSSATLADVNGDGRADLLLTMILGTGGSGIAAVMPGNGDGTFGPARTYGVNIYPRSMAVADVNGDGRADVVVANSRGQANSYAPGDATLLLGNGDGTFKAPTSFLTGGTPYGVAVADLNGDGKPDLVFANHSSINGPVGGAGVLLGAGNGTFSAVHKFAAANYVQSVSLGDVNGDGRVDIVLGVKDSLGAVYVLLGNGDGTFQAARSFVTDPYPRGVAVADVNGDGRLDIVSANSSRNSVGVLLGSGNGSFGAVQTYSVGTFPTVVVVSDLNGDGRADLVVGCGGTSMTVLMGSGDGGLAGPAYRISSAETAAFAPRVTLSAGLQPRSVALADVNLDGRPDVVFAAGGANQVGVLLGNGNATFAAVRTFGAGASPFSATVADLNTDGRPDLVVAVTGGNAVGVLLGNGNGTFAAMQTFTAGVSPRFVRVADVNGDGRADVVTANYGANTVGVLLGNGNGTLGGMQAFGTGVHPSSVAILDVNRDGRLDVLVSNKGSNSVGVLRGNGDGTFAGQLTFDTGGLPFAVAAADLNADGIVDVAVACESMNGVSELLGNGDGTFQVQRTFGTGLVPASLALADMNGDGRADAVVGNYTGNSVSVLLGVWDGSFKPQRTFAVGTSPFALATGDLNLDGRLDVVTADEGANTLSVLMGDPPPTVQSVNRSSPAGPDALGTSVSFLVTFSEPVTGVDPADFAPSPGGDVVVSGGPVAVSGSGAVYTVTVNGISGSGTLGLNVIDNGSIKDLPGNPLAPGGLASFQAMQTFAAGPRAYGVVSADLNGDGRVDLIVGNTNGERGFNVLLGRGDGTFGPRVLVSTSDIPGSSVAVGDVNLDGRPDVLARLGPNQIGVYLGNGDGSFQAAQAILTSNNPTGIVVADVNGDGKPDVTAGVGDAFVAVLLGNGNGTFQAQQTTYVVHPVPALGLAVADLNGDGKPDLVALDGIFFNSPHIVRVALGNGNGTFQTDRTFGVGARPRSVAVADLNLDGRLDLVVASQANDAGADGGTSVLLGNGNGTFLPARTFGVAGGSGALAARVSDVNGDGRPDLLVASILPTYGAREVDVLLGNGDGTFRPQQVLASGVAAFDIAVSDVNGDGRADVILPTYGGSAVGVLLGSADGSVAGQAYSMVPLAETLPGSIFSDSFVLVRDADGTDIDWQVGTLRGHVAVNDPTGLTINGNGGGDTITLDYSKGNPLPNTLHLNGSFLISSLQGTNPLANTTLEIGRSLVWFIYPNVPSDPIAAVRKYLSNGYNGGAWDGLPTAATGVITSTDARNDPSHGTGIGYADWADGTGVNTYPNSVKLQYTVIGDTDLDGTVGLSDYTVVVRNFGVGTNWTQGVVTYDGTVSLSDYTAVVRNFAQNTPTAAPAAMNLASSTTVVAGGSATPSVAATSQASSDVAVVSPVADDHHKVRTQRPERRPVRR